VWILKHELNPASDRWNVFFARLSIDPFAEQGDAAARDWDQSDEQSPDGRLPRTGFADQAQCLTVTDFEADAIDRTKQ
jgi:hypothetical protein